MEGSNLEWIVTSGKLFSVIMRECYWSTNLREPDMTEQKLLKESHKKGNMQRSHL